MKKVIVKQAEISVVTIRENDYISLTDIAKYKNSEANSVINNWMRNRNTIEYLGIWESLYNVNFKPIEFEGFKKLQAGLQNFAEVVYWGMHEYFKVYKYRKLLK